MNWIPWNFLYLEYVSWIIHWRKKITRMKFNMYNILINLIMKQTKIFWMTKCLFFFFWKLFYRTCRGRGWFHCSCGCRRRWASGWACLFCRGRASGWACLFCTRGCCGPCNINTNISISLQICTHNIKHAIITEKLLVSTSTSGLNWNFFFFYFIL